MPAIGCSELPLRYQQDCSDKNSPQSSPSNSEKGTIESSPIEDLQRNNNLINNDSENDEYEPNRVNTMSYTNMAESESLSGGLVPHPPSYNNTNEHLSPSHQQNYPKLTTTTTTPSLALNTMRPSRALSRYSNPYAIKNTRENNPENNSESIVTSTKGIIPLTINNEPSNRDDLDNENPNDFSITNIPSRITKGRYHPYSAVKRSLDNSPIMSKRANNTTTGDICNNNNNNNNGGMSDYSGTRGEYANNINPNGNNGIWAPSSYGTLSHGQNYHGHNYQEITQLSTNESPIARVTGTPSTFHYTNDNNNENNNNSGISNGISNGYHSPQGYKADTPTRQYSSTDSSPIPVETSIRNAFFTQDKVDTLCDVMLRDKNISMIAHILHDLPKEIHDSENILRARAALAFHSGNYQLLYSILDSRVYSIEHHKELQELYLSARYNDAAKTRARDLGAVDKYRIRKKYHLPRTIWDGEATSYTFKDRDRKILLECYTRSSYPSNEEKKELQRRTKLQKRQIDNWFKNRRQRDRPASQKNRKGKPPRQDCNGQLVMLPASSAGSTNSSHHYSQLPYHSPLLIDESMDIKYPVYPNGGNPLTPAQMKSYNMNELANQSHALATNLPIKHSTCKLPRNSNAKNSSSGWVKVDPQGVTLTPTGKVSKRKKATTSAAAGRITANEEIHNNNLSYSQLAYQQLYNQSGGRNSVGDNLDPSRSPSHSQGGQQQYSGTCSSVLINHQAGGWTSNWQSHVPVIDSTAYSSILPSFNHSHHAFNTEARIPVQ